MHINMIICALVIALAGFTPRPGNADDRQFAYVVIDDAAGYVATGRSQEGIDNALAILEIASQLPRRQFGDVHLSFIGTTNGAEFLSGSPREILSSLKIEQFTGLVTPQKFCGDFEELFTTIEYRLLRDAPEEAFIIVSSPLIDFESRYCTEEAPGAPQMPQKPKPEYLLEKILTHPAVKSFIVVGSDHRQEQEWFRYIAAIDGAIRPAFVKKEGVRSALLEAAQ